MTPLTDGVPNTATTLEAFAVSGDVLRVLCELERELLDVDVLFAGLRPVHAETSWERRSRLAERDVKQQWSEAWLALVPEAVRPLETSASVGSRTMSDALGQQLEGVAKRESRLTCGLILLEIACFEAYWPFRPGDAATDWPSLDAEVRGRFLENVSTLLGFKPEAAVNLRSRMLKAYAKLSVLANVGDRLASARSKSGVASLVARLAKNFMDQGTARLSASRIMQAKVFENALSAVASCASFCDGEQRAIIAGASVLDPLRHASLARVDQAPSIAAIACAKIESVIVELLLGETPDRSLAGAVLLLYAATIHSLEDSIIRNKVTVRTDRTETARAVVAVLQRSLDRCIEATPL